MRIVAKGKILLTGHPKIDRALKRIGDPKRTDKIIRGVMRDVLKSNILPAVRAAFPKDKGIARKAIKIRSIRTRTGAAYAVSITRANLEKALPNLGKKQRAIYPWAVEKGTPHQVAQAPFKETFEAKAAGARDVAIKAMAKEIMAAARN